MAKVLHTSFGPLPFDREKLGFRPLIGGVPLICTLERAADVLGEFLVGGSDDESTIHVFMLLASPFGPALRISIGEPQGAQLSRRSSG